MVDLSNSMQLLSLTLKTPAENLALDEALLDAAEAGELAEPVLRLWEPAEHFVVLGRSSVAEREVFPGTCQSNGVPIFRRSSGGGTIVAGPGCLMYAVVLGYDTAPHLRAIDMAHRTVLGTIASALQGPAGKIAQAGISDLVFQPSDQSSEANEKKPLQKFSGNALRCKRNHLLYHGTLLYDFRLELLGRWLQMPPRRPDYRADRDHAGFVANLPLPRAELVAALVEGWNAQKPMVDWPRQRVEQLVREKYQRIGGPESRV